MEGDQEDGRDRRKLVVFGRDVGEIPCFRSTFLTGIGSGFGGGLATFMFTSKPRLASHTAMGTFLVVTSGYWIWCRWNWSQRRFVHNQLKAGMKKYIAVEGTELDISDSSSRKGDNG